MENCLVYQIKSVTLEKNIINGQFGGTNQLDPAGLYLQIALQRLLRSLKIIKWLLETNTHDYLIIQQPAK